MAILAVNAGSSSLKFSMHPLASGQVQASVLSGNIEGLEPGGKPVMGWRFQGKSQQQALPVEGKGGDSFAQALKSLRELLATLPGVPVIEAVAHRVVHGGSVFRSSVLVDDSILEQLSALNSLAPLHQPHNVEGIRAFRAAFADLPQVACFDTAFHGSLAEVDYAFALPQELSAQGIRRYGFHGLSYQFVMASLAGAHTARQGTRADGPPGQRCQPVCGHRRAEPGHHHGLFGARWLDDGHPHRHARCRRAALSAGAGLGPRRLQKLLYKQSGLLGVSGISADMRTLRADGSESAQRAIAQFTHRVVREAGALTACIGGLDVLAFSGGIGEHDVALRQEVCAALSYLGVSVDAALNRKATGDTAMAIHAAGSAVEVWVIPTDEGQVAAREAARLIKA